MICIGCDFYLKSAEIKDTEKLRYTSVKLPVELTPNLKAFPPYICKSQLKKYNGSSKKYNTKGPHLQQQISKNDKKKRDLPGEMIIFF